MTELLRVENLAKHYPVRRGGTVRAVDGVSFEVHDGETLGVVGESGCGKSTLGRLIVQLTEPTAGRVVFRGTDTAELRGSALRAVRAELQIMFQDPYSSLSPRMTVHDIVAEPLRVQRQYRAGRVGELLDLVGLPESAANRYAHEFSGGQRQRIGLARALALRPRLLVLDEPVSALDVSIRAQVLAQLRTLQQELGLAYVFISHDLSVVRHVTRRVAVMYLGSLVEIGDRDDVFGAPQHPYTRALLAAVPRPDPAHRGARRAVLTGDLPDPTAPPSGCRFRTRCQKAQDRCATEVPELIERAPGHRAACHFPDSHSPDQPSPDNHSPDHA